MVALSFVQSHYKIYIGILQILNYTVMVQINIFVVQVLVVLRGNRYRWLEGGLCAVLVNTLVLIYNLINAIFNIHSKGCTSIRLVGIMCCIGKYLNSIVQSETGKNTLR